MKEWDRNCLEQLRKFFAEDTPYITCIESVIQGFQGKAFVDCKTNPSVVRLVNGPFNIMGGNAESASADEIISGAQMDGYFIGDSSWEEKVKAVYAERYIVHKRQTFNHGKLDKKWLSKLCKQVPEGIEIRKIGKKEKERIGREVSSLLTFYEEFLEKGIGFCALHEDRLVGGVATAINSEHAIQFQINTISEYRNRGIGTVLGARIVLYYLEKGIAPHWETADAASAHLAIKLGYEESIIYNWIEITE
jgi:GNAT superfamily N-acetyltransferase